MTAPSAPPPVVLREINEQPIERIVFENRHALSERIVFENRHALSERIEQLLDSGTRMIVLDLAACVYIDSSGCGVLVTASKKVRERGGQLVFAALTDDVAGMFKHTKLDQLFAIADTVERAIVHLEGP